MAETVIYDPSQSGANNALPWMLASQNNNGFLGGGNFWGAGIGGFLGSALGNLFNGNGFGMGGGNAAAASLGAQATANNNTELLRAAISSNGEQSRQAIQTVSSMIGQDFATVSSQFAAVNSILNSMAIQNATTPLQIVNAIVSGNKDMAAQFASCCCENKLLTTKQGYESQIATLTQTNQLSSQSDRNTNSIIGAINAQTVAMNDGFCQIKERELQSKIDSLTAANTVLRSQIDNAAQTQAFAAMLAPINAKLIEIENRQPQTVPVVYPNLIATPVTPTSTTQG